MSDFRTPDRVKREFIQILFDEADACADAGYLLSLPTLQDGWNHGFAPNTIGLPKREVEDLSWWFIQRFAPKEYPMARRVFNAVPTFFFDLARMGARMGKPPQPVDWNGVFYLRRHLLKQMWPSAYAIATHAAGHDGNFAKASEAVLRTQKREDWG